MSGDPRTRRRLERLAWLLDDSIRLPVINRRIGLDSVIGLVPVAGDIVGGALSLSILVGAARMGVRWPTLLRMLANVAVELAIGAIPIAGDLFDMGWKANRRNVTLMQEFLDAPQVLQRASRLRVFAVSALIVVALTGLAVATVWLLYAVGVALFGGPA